jgi:sucrose-6-phosphate hydrolase SacC (GH32 family)
MDQHGCGENDPNGPVFDPVHGVIHHFYQIHLAAPPGHGPDYGHFVSKDFVNWAPLPTAIWNGYDASTTPFTVTKYDNEAIYTGSAQIFDGAGPGGKGPGIVNIYPGLCNKNDWPQCGTGTLLAQAVPADYAGDELLVNWTKPSYNPIMENTERDPSSPWKTPFGTWRLRTFNQHVYEAESDAAVLKGQWNDLGVNTDFRGCECPSFYPLPAATPGFEEEYEALRDSAGLPTNVHKTSCGGDWWQLGTYSVGGPGQLGSFNATPGWEDLFAQRKIDQGHFYASKDNLYPTKTGGKRRINWGWATVPPQSTQTLPREITFNAAARCLQQYPIEELQALRGSAVSSSTSGKVNLPPGAAKNSEIIATFTLPKKASTFGVIVGDAAPAPAPAPDPESAVHIARWMNGTDMPNDDKSVTHHNASFGGEGCQAACDADATCKAWVWVVRGSPPGSGDCCLKSHVPCPKKLGTCTSGAKVATDVPKSSCGGASNTPRSTTCSVDYVPGAGNVSVSCGSVKDTVPLLPSETTFEIRIYSDATFLEAYFQRGRSAMTVTSGMGNTTQLSIIADPDMKVDAQAWPIKGIWTTPEAVRAQPRVYKA